MLSKTKFNIKKKLEVNSEKTPGSSSKFRSYSPLIKIRSKIFRTGRREPDTCLPKNKWYRIGNRPNSNSIPN